MTRSTALALADDDPLDVRRQALAEPAQLGQVRPPGGDRPGPGSPLFHYLRTIARLS